LIPVVSSDPFRGCHLVIVRLPWSNLRVYRCAMIARPSLLPKLCLTPILATAEQRPIFILGGLMGRAIFISYRRDDTEGEAGRLFDDLVRAYGDNSVFMDVAGINPGMDFRKAIDDNVSSCGVLLAMIGPTWATITNSSGERRLDDANDFVRLEIGSALARDIAVIPVLVHDAKMPRPDQLPENLKNLAYRNSVEITHARWNSDVQLLTQALSQYVAASSSTDTEPIHATVAVQLPPPHSPGPHPAPAKSSKMPLMVGIAVVVVLAIIGIVFFAMHHSGGNAATPAPNQSAPAAAAATPVQASSLQGRWQNSTNAEYNGLDYLDITTSGNQLSIEAWGNCQPKDCDWGGQTVSFDGQKATATFKFTQAKKHSGKEESRVATLTITPVNGALQVTVDSTTAGKPESQHQFTFNPSSSK
jgi:hypothetical protein